MPSRATRCHVRGVVVVGNTVGGVFMALHSAQGPQLGVPQMVQTRGQFGSYGSLLVIVLVIAVGTWGLLQRVQFGEIRFSEFERGEVLGEVLGIR